MMELLLPMHLQASAAVRQGNIILIRIQALLITFIGSTLIKLKKVLKINYSPLPCTKS